MGPSEDSASTRLWLGIFWPTRTRYFWKIQDSDSIGLDFLRLGLAWTRLFLARPITTLDPLLTFEQSTVKLGFKRSWSSDDVSLLSFFHFYGYLFSQRAVVFDHTNCILVVSSHHNFWWCIKKMEFHNKYQMHICF